MRKGIFWICVLVIFSSCSTKEQKSNILDEDKLGFINADVRSEETNLSKKALIPEDAPGYSEKVDRAFENAPPMIPHTTTGFFPIKIKSNICLSCHMPEKAKEIDGIPLPQTHFTDLRPELVKEGNVLKVPEDVGINLKKSDDLNNAYFNCSQCHVPQTEVSVQIENLFTPEFREEFGLSKSDLETKLEEGIK